MVGGGVPTFPGPGCGGGTYSQVWMVGGGYLLSGLDGGRVPTFPGPGWGGYLLSGLDGRGTYLPRSGWGGGTHLLGGGYLPK